MKTEVKKYDWYTEIYRKYGWYRPFFVTVNGKEYEIENIKIYNEKEEVILETNFFDNITSFTFKNPTKRKIKLKLDKTNFIIKSGTKYSGEPQYDLYIFQENVKIKWTQTTCSGEHVYHHYTIGNIGKDDFTYTEHAFYLAEKRSTLQSEIDRTIQEISDVYDYPLSNKELDKTFKTITKLNNELREEKERIKQVGEKINIEGKKRKIRSENEI